jgi:Xaa-Pro aminopeptidase
MRYEPLPSTFYQRNRQRLTSDFPPRGLSVVQANDVMPTNADGVLPFRQSSDLYYLCGIDQEETILALYPGAPDPAHREQLFITETSEQIATWEGRKLTKEQARALSGIETVHWTHQFDAVFRSMMSTAEVVLLNENDHLRASTPIQNRDARFVEECRRLFPLHQYGRLAPRVHRLRMVKAPEEVEAIRRAGAITEQGFRRVLRMIRPGVAEYEIEAEYAHEFIRRGSRGFAFSPIIASGSNSCVLHYIENHQYCRDGDLLLMDVGAEYANYHADMTRTVPVNGRFTDRQRAVYDAVLGILREGVRRLRPGRLLKEVQDDINALMDEALIELGLLTGDEVANQDKQSPPRRAYFMHSSSHHLGLDVHDVGCPYAPIESGMVFTIEPGIYIREEGLGVRLENDVLIGGRRNIDLMADVPIEADEIEACMNP